MSRLRLKLAIGVAVVGVAATTAAAIAGDRAKLRTSLSGYEEVPAVSTTGGGEFRAAIDRDSDRSSTSSRIGGHRGHDVTQSHIHLGQEGVNGGIAVFLCSNLGNGPAGTQALPAVGHDLGDDRRPPTSSGRPARASRRGRVRRAGARAPRGR